MSEPDNDRPAPGPPEDSEEVEILEIVGVDDAELPAPAGPPPASEDDEEIEVSFGEGAGDGPAPPPSSSAPLAPPSELDSLREKMLRIQADFENLERRMNQERAEYARYATADLVARLLPILDNLDRALGAARRRNEGDPFAEGLLLVRQQLFDELRREGLRPLEAMGQPFDPRLHEAVETGFEPDVPPGTILAELQPGYVFHERLLRPALVRVNVHGSEGGRGEGG